MQKITIQPEAGAKQIRTASGLAVAIRKFKIDDYERVIGLFTETRVPHNAQRWESRESVERQISQPNAVYLVAEVGGRIAGSIFATHDWRTGWINQVVVSPELQRRGIGKALMEEAENGIREFGIIWNFGLILPGNEHAEGFLKACGYSMDPKYNPMIYFLKQREQGVQKKEYDPAITARQYTTEDYERVLEVWKQAGTGCPDGTDRKDRLELQFSKPGNLALVAEAGGCIVGVQLKVQDGRRGYMTRNCVLPEMRRHGVSRMLKDIAEEATFALGLDMCAMTSEWTKNAPHFRARGYSEQPATLYEKGL
ncbi:MAG: GNAT family N-acetyltransferase [Candidatus Micrarchaeota archaeon]